MPGTYITVRPISAEEAMKIRKTQRIVNKGSLYTAGVVVLALATESIYRNLGGDPVIANYIFQIGGYTLLTTGIVTLLNNQESVIGPETSSKEGLESKVSNS